MPSSSPYKDWPGSYVEHFADRQSRLLKLRASPELWVGAKEYYRTRPVEFIEHWCVTVDPRNAFTDVPTKMPFIMFTRQREFVEFLYLCVQNETSGLVEKARDMGATWVCCAFSVWLFLFHDGAAVGWGSRKEQLVDRIGDMSSIFEKIRAILNNLPREFLPDTFSSDDMTYMKCLNRDNGASITGESGDNIGRGGRTLIYFKDESAHYERPEKIEAALADNTRVQIDISSVNGTGNVFHRKREAGVEFDGSIVKGKTNVFVMDWRDHPHKTQEWYDQRRATAEESGLLHLFAQEVDRNYAASIEGVIIPPAWVKAAIDAHVRLGITRGLPMAGLDVADGGGDKNALAIRMGAILDYADDWGARDTGVTTRKAITECRGRGRMEIQYDCIGVGAGVKSEANRLLETGDMPRDIMLVAWNAASSPINPSGRVVPNDPDSPRNKAFYANLKAQAWWSLRARFEKTFRAITEGVEYDPDELIAIPGSLPRLRQIEKELSQATFTRSTSTLKLVVDKSPEGTKSPNLADAIVMAFWPANSAPPIMFAAPEIINV